MFKKRVNQCTTGQKIYTIVYGRAIYRLLVTFALIVCVKVLYPCNARPWRLQPERFPQQGNYIALFAGADNFNLGPLYLSHQSVILLQRPSPGDAISALHIYRYNFSIAYIYTLSKIFNHYYQHTNKYCTLSSS